jgi:hypothetical protein
MKLLMCIGAVFAGGDYPPVFLFGFYFILKNYKNMTTHVLNTKINYLYNALKYLEYCDKINLLIGKTNF